MITGAFPHPDAESGRIGDERHALLALAKAVRQLRSPKHLTSQFVAHRCNDGQVEGTCREWRDNHLTEHQRGLHGGGQRKEYDTAPQRQRLSPVSASPNSGRGICNED